MPENQVGVVRTAGAYGLWAALLGYTVLVPHYYLFPTGSHHLLALTLKFLPVILIAALTICCCPLLTRGRVDLVGTVLLLHLSIQALSLLWTTDARAAAIRLAYYTCTGILLVWLVRHQSRRLPGLPEYLALSLVVIGGLVSLNGVLSYVFSREFLWSEVMSNHNPYYMGTERLSSTLGNPVVAGGVLCIFLPLCLWAGMRSRERRSLYFGIAILTAIAILLTFSRGALIAGLTAGVVVLAASQISSDGRRCRTALVLLLVFLLSWPSVELIDRLPVGQRVASALNARWQKTVRLGQEDGYRIEQYRVAGRIASIFPLAGTGFGSLTGLFKDYSVGLPADGAQTVDNMFLFVLCENGVLGLLLFAATPAILLHLIGRRLSREEREADFLFLICSRALVLAAVANMLTWDSLNHPTIRIVYWTAVGILMAHCDRSSSSEGLSRKVSCHGRSRA